MYHSAPEGTYKFFKACVDKLVECLHGARVAGGGPVYLGDTLVDLQAFSDSSPAGSRQRQQRVSASTG